MKLTNKMEKKNVFEMVTDRIVAQLQQGNIPWHKPWGGVAGIDAAISHESGKPYSLVNQMILGKAGEWLTFMQVQKEGGRIKRGEEASFVVFWKQCVFEEKVEGEKNEDGTDKTIQHVVPVLKWYNVWHIDQTEGIEPKHKAVVDGTAELVEDADEIVNTYVLREGIKLQNDKPSDRAFYRPSTDEVVVPMISQYESSAEYYSTMFHELTHSTGHESRLHRLNKVAAFGSEEYSREELVAEMGAAYLCTMVGVDTDNAFRNSAAYIKGWLQALKNDAKMVVVAAGKAEAAVRYILNGKDNNK